ncbi:MAG: nucleotidyl transferase AbiEii/AbiGii toxin family protein, partial [Chloroflexi bacterium]|nr:nucleotidyl transferase AbiEii/AbiGii toxin family protein [Chloroflexota bacterium]
MNVNFDLQDRFLERFFASPIGERFYLTGGTALARFYFNHRESLDLDLFTNEAAQDFAVVNRVVLGILFDLKLSITSQVATDTFLQYILADAHGV